MSNTEENERRMEYAQLKIEAEGYEVFRVTDKELQFEYKGALIHFFPYTGWASGKTIKDGRGINNLINQIRR